MKKYVKAFFEKVSHFIPDKLYILIRYRMRMGEWPNLKNPITYNEKLQWIKLYDRKPEYSTMVDKYAVKEYVKKLIGDEYIIPTLGVWDKFEDIDFNKLPQQFVLKCTHDSGGLVICSDKNKLDIEAARKKINGSLNSNYYWHSREWPYKNVKPRIIAEQYMADESGVELKDYKIFTFNGVPKFIQVDFGRFSGHRRNLYTTDWEYMDVENYYPTDPDTKIEKPVCLEKLLELSRVLSAGIPHLRTDFYIIDGKIYFGELTFFHGSGMKKYEPRNFEVTMGNWMELPIKK